METSNTIDMTEASGWFTFPAIRGVQAGREYYTAMVPFKQIPRIFVFNEYEVPPEMRAQRKLNKSRVPKIVNYVVQNIDDYVFSALTSSIDGEMHFIPNEEGASIGNLKISLNATLVINDGQHRRAAIEEVLKETPELAYESIPVVFFVDLGLKKSQQMFADLNKNAVRPSRSLSILYNIRDGSAQELMKMIQNVPIFKGRIELEKTSISKRSKNLFTLSSLYGSCKYTYQEVQDEDELERRTKLLEEYFIELTTVIKPWNDVYNDRLPTWQFREDYVCSHGVLLDAIGMLGLHLFENHPTIWKEKLQGLRNMEWFRNQAWEGVAMQKGRMVKSNQNVKASFEKLKQNLV